MYYSYVIPVLFMLLAMWQVCDFSDSAINKPEFWAANFIYGLAGSAGLFLFTLAGVLVNPESVMLASFVFIPLAMFIGTWIEHALAGRDANINFYS